MLYRCRRVIKDQTMTCELIPFEPEEESSQLQFEESTGMHSAIVIMKVISLEISACTNKV